MRDLRVQEFLRELIVGVAAPSDLAGSILVKILHCGEGRNVEQVAQTSKQFSLVCDCSSLSTHLFLYLACSYCAYLYILDITCAQLNICLGLFSILHCSYSLYIHCMLDICLLYTSPSPRDRQKSRMPSSA